MKHSEEQKNITQALVNVVPKIKNLFPSAKAFGFDYIPLENIIDEIKPKLAEFGLVCIQMPISNGNVDTVGVVTRLMHISGEWIEDEFYGPLTNLPEKKQLTNLQKMGASISFMRRYGLAAIFGITADVNVDKALGDEKPDIENIIEMKIKEFNELIQIIDKSKVDNVDKTNIQNTINLINIKQIKIKQLDNMINNLKQKYVK